MRRQPAVAGSVTDAYRAVKTAAGRAFGFVKDQVPEVRQPVTRESFRFTVDKNKLKEAELARWPYLLRSNLPAQIPLCSGPLLQLTQIESASVP